MEDICEICTNLLNKEEKLLYELSVMIEEISKENVTEIKEILKQIFEMNTVHTENYLLNMTKLLSKRPKDAELIQKALPQTFLPDFKSFIVNNLEASSLEKEILDIIQSDDIQLWQEVLVSGIEEDHNKIRQMAIVASIYGSEKIMKAIMLNLPDIIENENIIRHIIDSGNTTLIRMMPVLPNAPSIALSCIRPRLAQWFLQNEVCSIPSFEEIEQCFALNVLCTLSHHPSCHIFYKSLESKYSCFAKMNIMNSNVSLSFVDTIHFGNAECIKIAFDHHYLNFDKSLKICIQNKQVDLARELLKYDFAIENDTEKEHPIAAALCDLDRSLLEPAIEHGAKTDNPFIQSMLIDFPDDYQFEFMNYYHQIHLVKFIGRFGREHNIKLINSKLTREPCFTGFKFPTKYQSSRRRMFLQKMPYKICYLNNEDAKFFKFDQYPTCQYDPHITEFIALIVAPGTIMEMLNLEQIKDLKLILYYGSYNDTADFPKLESFARQYDVRLLVMDESIDEDLFKEVISETMKKMDVVIFK